MISSGYDSVRVSSMTSYIEVSIDRDITAPEDFREEIAAIRSGKEGDVIFITLNTGGGRLDTANAILSAMRYSKAHIITEAVGCVASAGTCIFLAGDECRVRQDVEFMIHTASYGYGGKANNVAEYVAHQQKAVNAFVTKNYEHFLTEEEIEKVITGSDYWMGADELILRLNNRAATLQAFALEAASKASGVKLDVGREDVEKWTKARLVSFICDESYRDADWGTKKPIPSFDIVEEIKAPILGEDLAEALVNPSSVIAEEVKIKLKVLAKEASISYPHNIGIMKLYEKVKHLLE